MRHLRPVVVVVVSGIFFAYIGYYILPANIYAEDRTYYLHTDQLGSVMAVTDENGSTVQQTAYMPYGEELASSPSASSGQAIERGYTGQIKDALTSLSYYNARYYDPLLSRLISADTVGGGNRFTYVAGNPILFNDPNGNLLYAGGGGGGGDGDRRKKIKLPPPPPIQSSNTYDTTRCAGAGCTSGGSVAPDWANDVSDIALGGLYAAYHTIPVDILPPLEAAGSGVVAGVSCTLGFVPGCVYAGSVTSAFIGVGIFNGIISGDVSNGYSTGDYSLGNTAALSYSFGEAGVVAAQLGKMTYGLTTYSPPNGQNWTQNYISNHLVRTEPLRDFAPRTNDPIDKYALTRYLYDTTHAEDIQLNVEKGRIPSLNGQVFDWYATQNAKITMGGTKIGISAINGDLTVKALSVNTALGQEYTTLQFFRLVNAALLRYANKMSLNYNPQELQLLWDFRNAMKLNTNFR